MNGRAKTETSSGLGSEDLEERLRIGATLRALREARGATPDQVANAIGISRPLLANVEAGRRRLNYKHLPKIAEYLGVPPIAIMRPEHPAGHAPGDGAGAAGVGNGKGAA